MKLLQDYLRNQAERRPEAAAVVQGSETWSYGDLEIFSNRLARSLQESGARSGDRVALLIDKSPRAVGAVLAVLKAGCIYVPVDLHGPAERALKVLVRSEPRLLLADFSGARLIRDIESLDSRFDARVGWLDREAPRLERGHLLFDIETISHHPHSPPDSCGRAAAPEGGAYILFTSGSTGDPKGVLITHENVTAFVEWAVAYFGMTSDDRVSGHTPLHFDLSVFDIFGTIAAGASLQIVPPAAILTPPALADFIRTSSLTQWFSVPSVLNYLAKFDAVRRNDFPQLRRLLWCGEVLPTPTLQYWMDRLPHVQFTNLYGPTETTIASSYYTVSRKPASSDQSIPIGKACAGESLLVLKDTLLPAAAGETGEICIAGAGLSPGYWRDPEKTQSVFVTKPDDGRRIYRTGDLGKIGPDGLVYFVGRKDSQIKSRGYRIELGEVEAALHTLPSLAEAAVVATPSSEFDGMTICCGFVPAPSQAVTPSMVRTQLRRKIPGYMVPSRWLALNALPKNANGKIDRRKLQEMFEARVGAAK